jgi:PleD family two-component response regulator
MDADTLQATRAVDEDNPPILIATDRVLDAETIARVLSEEFARVHVSTDPKRGAQDLALRKPGVLVLAFDTLPKAERHFDALCQPGALAHVPPLRVLLLCSQEDLREAYEACKKGRFDDFVLFWPKTDETRPLRMAVRRALGQASALRDDAPGASEFAAQARRLAALEPLLEEQIAKAGGDAAAEDGLGPVLDAVRALRGLAERRPPLVLVVDDDKFQHKLLGQVLAPAKLELVFAVSATEAIAGLHKRRPDLILMDVSLPDLDGVQATRLLKCAAPFAAIPVIMITGVGGRDMVIESLKAGATDFVVKPFDKSTLLAKVRKVLYGRALPP